MIKTAVSSYSFSQYLNDGRMTLVDCVAKAKELGFDAIEYTDANGFIGVGIDSSDPENEKVDMDSYHAALDLAGLIRDESERADFPIINCAFGANLAKDFPNRSQVEIDRVKACVDVAAELGVPVMRHDATFGYPGMDYASEELFDEMLPILADACREITEYAATKGIRTMVENHGLFCQDSHRVEHLMLAVDHPNFGWLVDIGNFMCADESSETACARAAKYAFHVHAKDFHYKDGDDEPDPGEGFFSTRGGNKLRGSILGHGSVPVQKCLGIIKDTGYDSYVSLEFEGMEDSLLALRIGRENLARFLNDAVTPFDSRESDPHPWERAES